MKLITYISFVCMVSIGLSACLPQKPMTVDIIGLWVEVPSRTTPAATPGQCGSLQFYADGQFAGTNIPWNYFSLNLPSNRVNGKGQWNLENSQDLLGWDEINLLVELPDGNRFGTRMEVASDGSERELFASMGDESNRVTFVKRSKVEC